MVKPYCEDCGKHRGSYPYCCDAETKRIAAGAKCFYMFAVAAIVVMSIAYGVVAYFM